MIIYHRQCIADCSGVHWQRDSSAAVRDWQQDSHPSAQDWQPDSSPAGASSPGGRPFAELLYSWALTCTLCAKNVWKNVAAVCPQWGLWGNEWN